MKMDVYVGTYSLPIKFGTGEILEGKGKGIYRYEFDTETYELTQRSVTEGVDNPSYLAINRDTDRLYAVNELKEYAGKPSGAVSAFRINQNGALEFINKMPTDGTDPCHVALSPDENHLIVSNFMSGSVSVYPVLKDGSLGVIEQFIQYEGKGVNPHRQTCPHAHSATFSMDAKYVYICDLGTDRVRAYPYSDSGCPLMEEGMTEFIVSPGAGPRYSEFADGGRFCYVINELGSAISVTEYDEQTGTLTEIQKISTLPRGAIQDNICADLHITPDGQFLYASNRGMDSIAAYRIDKGNGMLSLIGFEPADGRTPRNFAIDKSGNFLLCANQDSDNIVVFAIDNITGRLEKKSETYAPTPVCVKILKG